MPSNALEVHLHLLMEDVQDLNLAHADLRTGSPGRQYGLAALNRSAVVMSVAAWEAYVEELMRESLQALRPPAPPLGAWPALSAYVHSQLGRFHTPNPGNVVNLIHYCTGLTDVRPYWRWQNCTSAQAVRRLDDILRNRHQIAHGVSPRPTILNQYSSGLPRFFRRLARCTDEAVRNHLVTVHSLTDPWPP